MPISNAVFVRSTIALLLVGMLALLGIVATSLWLVTSVQSYFGELIEVRTVRSASADLLAAPEYASRLPELDRLVAAKLSELRETVSLVQAGNIAEAAAIVRTDRGREIMDAIRTAIGDIITDADRRLSEGVNDTLSFANALQWTTVVCAIAIVAVLSGAIAIVV